MMLKGTWCIVLVLILLSVVSTAYSSGLDENLQLLKPFVGKDWVGGYVGDGATDVVITLAFEPILDGKAIKTTRVAKGADFTGEFHIYWNPHLKEVRFLSLNNRGLVGEGTVTTDGDKVVLLGTSHSPADSTEFKTVLHLTEAGVLRDLFFRKKNGEWVLGHIQEFHGRDGN